MSQKKESVFKYIRLIPVMLAVAFVPLISTAKRYENGLTGFSWFSNSGSSVDIFLYWKGQALIMLAFVMLAFLLFSSIDREWMPGWRQVKKKEMIFLSAYLVLAVLSSVFSKYKKFAFSGGYEQWEGLNVLLAYGMLFVFILLTVDSEKQVRALIYALVAGSLIMGVIGTFQYLDGVDAIKDFLQKIGNADSEQEISLDLFRTDFGQAIMNLMSEQKMNFSFNFSEGWVYATLYNPNYVGSYAALVLPVLITIALIEWKEIPVICTLGAMLGSCLMVVTLFGSQSLTGCIGVIASLVFVLAARFSVLYQNLGLKKMLIGAGCIVLLAGISVLIFPEEIKYGVNKVFHPTPDTHTTKSLLSSDRGLQVTTVKGDIFFVKVTGDTQTPFEVTDEGGQELTIEKDAEMNFYTFQDERFSDFQLYPRTVSVSDGDIIYDAVKILNPSVNREWTLAKTDSGYRIYNSLGKMDDLREIQAWGFENCQHFATKRGYLWSRTIPLLKNYLVLGSGPDTFTVTFPNYDYVGKMNMNYDGVTVTKPHNMYFQIWTQTGFLSLLAFLLLVGGYFVGSIKLYFGRSLSSITEQIGFALMVSVFGYMVTGLANDSTVAVAPVFWALLAIGIVVNHMIFVGGRQSESGKK